MESKADTRFPKVNLKLLVEGKLDWEEVKKAIRVRSKDEDRLWNYLEVLQERVSWKDQISMMSDQKMFGQAKEVSALLIKLGLMDKVPPVADWTHVDWFLK